MSDYHYRKNKKIIGERLSSVIYLHPKDLLLYPGYNFAIFS